MGSTGLQGTSLMSGCLATEGAASKENQPPKSLPSSLTVQSKAVQQLAINGGFSIILLLLNKK
jgi:hypothetical protein